MLQFAAWLGFSLLFSATLSLLSLSGARQAHCRDCKHQCRSPVPLREVSIVGSCYGQLCPFADIANMPVPARAIVHHSVDIFARTDQGVVQNSNNKTMDNRAARFCDWLSTSCGYHYLCCAQSISPTQAQLLVGSYVFLHHVGNLPVNRKGNLPMANTLAHHAQAASHFLQQVMEAPFSIYESGTSKPTLVPFIGDRISQRCK
jgi:hypothetical protein